MGDRGTGWGGRAGFWVGGKVYAVVRGMGAVRSAFVCFRTAEMAEMGPQSHLTHYGYRMTRSTPS